MKRFIISILFLALLGSTSEILAQKMNRKQDQPTIEEHLAELTDLLTLNEQQKNSIKPLIEKRMKENQKMRAERDSNNQKMQQKKRQQMHAARQKQMHNNQQFIDEMKVILTTDQFNKWQAYRDQKMGQRMRENQERRSKKQRN